MEPRRIDRYMTPAPHSIARGQPLSEASEKMREHGIRHLPVVHEGNLVGVISQRDIALANALSGTGPLELMVEQAMTPAPYTVSPTEPLGNVVRAMAEHRYGCAIVVEDGAVIGLLTTTDTLRLLWDHIVTGGEAHEELAPSEVRHRIADDHRRIRRMLEDVERLAKSVKGGNAAGAAQLRIEARKLYHALCAHTDLEDRILAPALKETPGFGDIREKQLLTHHEEQRAQLRGALEQLDTEDFDALTMAETAIGIVVDLRIDMAHEDKDLLSANLLSDDPIQVDFSG